MSDSSRTLIAKPTMTSKPCDTDTMDSKNDDDGLSGVFKAPPPTRVQSPMRPVLTGQAPSDLEAQYASTLPPGITLPTYQEHMI